MEITEVKVFPINEEKLKAFVSVVFDQCFMVNDIKVIQGKDGLFISMPSRKKKNGEFKDVAHPLNNGTRRMIEGEILAEYDRVLDERGLRSANAPAVEPRPLTDAPPAGIAALSPVAQPEGRRDDGESRPWPNEAAASEATPQMTRKEAAEEPSKEETSEEGSLEEVQEMHLKDSFWTV